VCARRQGQARTASISALGRNRDEDSAGIEQLTGLPAHAAGFRLSGKLHDEDDKTFVPLVDAELARVGRVNVLAQFHDFRGWDLHALGDDLRFAATHCAKINRIALVGEKVWER
jgi:hypothetical protein